MFKLKLNKLNDFAYYLGSLGQLVQTPGSPSRNNIGNTSVHSSSNAPGPAVSSQISGPSNMLGRLPPHQITPSAIGKSNHPSKNLIFKKNELQN